jgi:hypothetical protein
MSEWLPGDSLRLTFYDEQPHTEIMLDLDSP